jgi:Glu-tRNA(Gln) amidotransferase subunit E-like FAD-binding protein
MKTKIKLPEDNNEGEIPIKIASVYIFIQTYQRTRSVQLALVEVLECSTAATKKLIMERDTYTDAEGNARIVELVTDLFHERYDVVERTPLEEVKQTMKKMIKETFPQEPIPANFELDKAYPVRSDMVMDSARSFMSAQGAENFLEILVKPSHKAFSDEFFHEIIVSAKRQGGNPTGININGEDRTFTIMSADKIKKRKMQELMEGLADHLDLDDLP